MEPNLAFWSGRTVMVTGSTGLMGSALSERLLSYGAVVLGITRDATKHSYLHYSGIDQKMELFEATLLDYDTIHRILNTHQVDTCFHLAAESDVGKGNRLPMPSFEANIKGSWTLLEALRHTPSLTRAVVASSDKAYGDNPVLPYTEDMALLARHPYAASKACTDILAQTYHHTYGTPLAVTRFGNLYGAGDMNFTRIVPGTMRAAFRGERPIIRSDSTPQRDYIWVNDAVDFYLVLAQEMDREEVRGQAFNYGTGKPLSVLQFIQAILAAAGRSDIQPEILGLAPPKGEIIHQYLSHKKIQDYFGWTPLPNLEKGLADTWVWYKNFLEHAEKNSNLQA